MGPKKVRIDPSEAVYRSATPAVQQKFPRRRRSVKAHGSAPPKLREQSTLTQLDWSFSTEPSSELGDDDDDDDDDKDEDEDEDEDEDGLDRPKRKRKRKRRRRTLGDGKRQTTLTQLVGASFEGDSDGAADVVVMQSAGQDAVVMHSAEQDAVRDSQSSPTEEQGARQEAGGTQATRVDSARRKAQARPSPSPELPVSTAPVRTPRRRFPSEIPSSSTPQSAILSAQKRCSRRSPDRSPLTSRSARVWPQQPSPERARLSPVLDTPPNPVSHFRFRIPEKPPPLQHRSTIPDSEDTATQLSPPRGPKFPSQIPDTQFDLFGHEVTAETETQHHHTCDTGGETYSGDDFAGYDPACSALDRDAARFMQTQRLLDLRRQQASVSALLLFTQDDQHTPRPSRHSPELGAETLSAAKRPAAQHTAPSTHSPLPSPPGLPSEDEIEVVDLTESFVPRADEDPEVIRIASSAAGPSSDVAAAPSDKYPSSPPLGPPAPSQHGPGPGPGPASSPPLPSPSGRGGKPRPAPSQVSTVAGTQPGWPKRDVLGRGRGIDTSTPPPPPSTSSPPPPGAGGKTKVLDSEDEGEDGDGDGDGVVLEGVADSQGDDDDDDDDGDLDLGVVGFWGRQGPTAYDGMDAADDGRDDGRSRGDRREDDDDDDDDDDEGDTTIRDLRDILPDTLLDFSLPPPPPPPTTTTTTTTQTSVGSS